MEILEVQEVEVMMVLQVILEVLETLQAHLLVKEMMVEVVIHHLPLKLVVVAVVLVQ